MKISIVSPVYKAENIVDELVSRVEKVMKKMNLDYELILVDDCGPDDSWSKIVSNAQRNSCVKGIKLSRNFGQHHAITAGLDASTGDWVVVMDCDLQDQPEEILSLYNKAQEGFDIVFARRANRQDSFFKRMSSVVFYKAFAYLSGVPQDGTIANFGIYSRKVIQAINSMREPMRAFSPMAKWVGFKNTAIDVDHAERFEGSTSYNWSKLINLALDISMAYSEKPLRMAVKAGIGISVLAFVFAIYNVVAFFLGWIHIQGYASLIISIWFFSGLIILSLGVVGLYIGKIFDSVKGRPLYIIDKTV
jgi:polyisoprenyl-phosphate glycosyltransferase